MNMKHSPTEIHCDICIITCMFWTYVNSCTVCHFSNTVELNWGNLCSVVKSKISNMMGDLINLCILCCSGTVMSMIAKKYYEVWHCYILFVAVQHWSCTVSYPTYCWSFQASGLCQLDRQCPCEFISCAGYITHFYVAMTLSAWLGMSA